MTGVILIGGKSRRMGQDKALMDVGGVPVFYRVLDVFEVLFDEILVVSNEEGKFAHWGNRYSYKEVVDLITDCGPIGGIYTGLYHARSSSVFVASCDLPFIHASIVEFFMKEASSYDIVVPDIGGRLHPLHATYSKSCIPYMLEWLESSSLNLTEFINDLQDLSIKRVEIQELGSQDPELKSLFNMNTKQDWMEANKLVE